MTTNFDPGQAPSNQVNILDNGGFEIWQRGTTFTNPASPSYTTDRWYVNATETTGVVVSQNSSVVDTGNYSMEVNVTAAGSSKTWNIAQITENYAAYGGKTLTLSCRVWSNTANAVSVYLASGATSAQSAYHPGDSTWHRLSATITVPTSPSGLSFNVGMINSGDKKVGIYYFDSAMLVQSFNPAVFIPFHPQVDLARCQRYYTLQNSRNGSNVICSNGSTTNFFSDSVTFHQTMRIAPTITFSGTVVDTVGIPTNGVASIVDTSNWTLTAGNVTTDGFQGSFSRNSFQGTYASSFWAYSWAASADF